ncbi:MAG: hypothetical protein AAF438_04165, partial [Pseudomonadota bacterium]
LGSLVLAFFAYKQRPWALSMAFAAALGFFGVYAIDLAQIFPRSPTPMSFALALIEVLGMTAAVPLMFAARNARADANHHTTRSKKSALRYATAATLAVVGIVIVWFATDAAMSGGELSVQNQGYTN